MGQFKLLDKVKVIGGLLKGNSGKIVYDLLDGGYKVKLDNGHINIIQGYNLALVDRNFYTKDEYIEVLENRWKNLKEWLSRKWYADSADLNLGDVINKIKELEKE